MPAGCTIFTKNSLAETLLTKTLIEAINATGVR